MSWGPSPEYADWWYVLSWKGILWSLGIAAFAAVATGIFTVLQFWSDGIKDRRAEERHQALALQSKQAILAAAEANLALERERIARLKLEEYFEKKTSPRRLTPGQKHRICEALVSTLIAENIEANIKIENTRETDDPQTLEITVGRRPI